MRKLLRRMWEILRGNLDGYPDVKPVPLHMHPPPLPYRWHVRRLAKANIFKLELERCDLEIEAVRKIECIGEGLGFLDWNAERTRVLMEMKEEGFYECRECRRVCDMLEIGDRMDGICRNCTYMPVPPLCGPPPAGCA